MQDEDENVVDDDALEISDAELDTETGFGADEEDSYDPDDRFH